MSTAKTIVYAARGSSHSWTWLADLFESKGVIDTRFLDSKKFISALVSDHVETAIVSGGDGFAIAESLSGQGFRNLEEFILEGGIFVGICAGAYLPLPSSVEPFSEFNISTTKVENISCVPQRGGRPNPRESVAYGNCSIIHPVRGPVEITIGPLRSVVAPLFGGPVFKEPMRDTVMMRYKRFTPETELISERTKAEEMMYDKPAVVRVVHGRGSLMLFGPHLEHPRYPEANGLFLRLLGYDVSDRPEQEAVPVSERTTNAELIRSISDLKVAILGLENRSFTVGNKAWDGSRLLEIVSAIEKRGGTLSPVELKPVVAELERVRDLVIGMKVGSESDPDETTSLLVEVARKCVDNHFAVLSGNARLSSRGSSSAFHQTT